jgi:hypothetical protein
MQRVQSDHSGFPQSLFSRFAISRLNLAPNDHNLDSLSMRGRHITIKPIEEDVPAIILCDLTAEHWRVHHICPLAVQETNCDARAEAT